MFVRYKHYLKSYAQTNRKLCTKSEWLVWNCFLKWDKMWYRFLRQKPIAGYILDFYCPQLKLCIEIDGESHEWKGDYDQKRDSVIKDLWIKTIRYRDDIILKHLESVGLDIEYVIFERVGEINKSPVPKSPILKDTSPFEEKGVHGWVQGEHKIN